MDDELSIEAPEVVSLLSDEEEEESNEQGLQQEQEQVIMDEQGDQQRAEIAAVWKWEKNDTVYTGYNTHGKHKG